VPEEICGLFRVEHLSVIEKRLKDPIAYQVLIDALPRLAEIVREAQRRGLGGFKCHLGRFPAFPMQICFGDSEDNRYTVSMSLRKAYEKQRPFFDMETALALESCIQSLVLNIDGIQPMRRIRQPRRERSDG
jgi:hypothetical protein